MIKVIIHLRRQASDGADCRLQYQNSATAVDHLSFGIPGHFAFLQYSEVSDVLLVNILKEKSCGWILKNVFLRQAVEIEIGQAASHLNSRELIYHAKETDSEISQKVNCI